MNLQCLILSTLLALQASGLPKKRISSQINSNTKIVRTKVIDDLGEAEFGPLFVPGTKDLCGTLPGVNGRIVGGRIAKDKAWPWLAALGYKGSEDEDAPVGFLCMGVLISKHFVITAGHCVYNSTYKLDLVRLGTNDLGKTEKEDHHVDIKVKEIIIHPKYVPEFFQNDITILKLATPVEYAANIQPICLPYTKKLQGYKYAGNNTFLAGFGAVGSNAFPSSILLEVQLPIVDLPTCKAAYNDFKSAKIDDSNICAGEMEGGKDTCQGDSGGPLQYKLAENRWATIGVVSYGYKCAEKGYPGVYSRVTHHLQWIQKVTGLKIS